MSSTLRRTRRLLTTLAVSALAAPLLLQGVSQAEPEIEEVRERVDRLYHRAEIASERYNDIRLELDESRARVAALRSDVRRQRRAAEQVRDEVAAAVVARYQGEAFSSAAQVLLSEDPDTFLETLSTVAAYDDQQAQVMHAYATEARRLELRKQAMASSPESRTARSAWPPRRRASRTRPRRPRSCSPRSRPTNAGSWRMPRHLGARPSRPGCPATPPPSWSTRSPRWARPTSGPRPVPAATTVPG